MEFEEIWKRPYRRVFIFDSESNTFTALIDEFPGCVAQGETLVEAEEELRRTAESWIEGTLESGLLIPQPRALTEHIFIGELSINFHARTVRTKEGAGPKINLTRMEWRLLERLAENLGQVVSYDEIMFALWSGKRRDMRNLRTLVSRVKDKLGEEIIETRFRMGLLLKKDEEKQHGSSV